MTPTRNRGLALAAGSAVISGVAIWVNSSGLATFANATAYTTAKNAMAAIVIAAVFLAARRARGADAVSLTRPARPAQWWALLYVAILGGAVPFVLFFNGLASTASTQAAFLHKMLIVWVALLAVPLLKERLTVWHGAAIALLVIGQLGLAGAVAFNPDLGIVMIAAATLMWSVEVVATKRLLVGVTPWTVSLVRMGGGSVALLAWAGATGKLGGVVPHTSAQWGWILLTGLLLAGYVLTWHQALWRALAVDVTAVLVLGAVVTAVLAGVFDGAPIAAKAPWLALLAAGGLLVWLAPRPAPVGTRALT